MTGNILQHKLILIALLLVLVAAAAAPSVYFYRKYQDLQKQVSKPSTADNLTALIAKVGKHILLPTGELPTALGVTDKEKLSGQQFFANAKNGDILLVYEKAKKAFLYDPFLDKIIEVGPILTASSSGSVATPVSTPTTASQIPYTFAVFNATQVKGLAETYSARLTTLIPGVHIVARGNAKGDYTSSLLVDVAGTHKEDASVLAKKLGVSVAAMPAGESTPSADFLIILGADQK